MFLKLFLNSGYYLSDGCIKLIQELKKTKAKLTIDDLLTDLIEDKAKKYMLWLYENSESVTKN